MMIETKRMILRELEEKDYDDLCEILQDEEVMYAYEHAFSKTEVDAWFHKQKERYKQDGFGLWAVILKENNKMIGQCGLTRQQIPNQEVIEIGYLFNKQYWHQGYAIEAAISCKEYAFSILHEKAVYSIIRDSNKASKKVALRNGMVKVSDMMKHYYDIDMLHEIYKVERNDL